MNNSMRVTKLTDMRTGKTYESVLSPHFQPAFFWRWLFVPWLF